jgi:hypothetical protein
MRLGLTGYPDVSGPRAFLTGLLCLALLAPPDAARAQSTPDYADGTGYAHRGTWVLWADQGLFWASGNALTAARVASPGETDHTFTLRLSADRFLTDWLTAGLVAGGTLSRVAQADHQPDTSFSWVAGLRVGFAVPIAARSVFWPRAAGLVALGSHRTSRGFTVHAPFVREVAPGFLVGFGPAYEYRYDDLDGEIGNRNGIGMLLSFAGAFSTSASQPAPAEPPRERFGRAGQWSVAVRRDISGAGRTSAYWAQLWEPKQTTGSLLILGTLDWFPFDHLSLGFALGFGKTGQLREDAELGATVGYFGGQLGGAIPVGASFVLRPYASVLWSSTESAQVRQLQLFVPLALELGHFLLGLGPSIERQHHEGSLGDSAYDASVVGLTLLVAGWWN